MLNISRAFGDSHFECQGLISEPSVEMLPLRRGEDEFVILCSDGLTDVKTDEEIVGFVRDKLAAGNASLSSIGGELMKCSIPATRLRNGYFRGPDNMSIVIIVLAKHA